MLASCAQLTRMLEEGRVQSRAAGATAMELCKPCWELHSRQVPIATCCQSTHASIALSVCLSGWVSGWHERMPSMARSALQRCAALMARDASVMRMMLARYSHHGCC
jgi:hypothetical protein